MRSGAPWFVGRLVAGRLNVLAGPGRVDAREVYVAIDGTQNGAQGDEYDQNDKTDKHCRPMTLDLGP